MTKEEAKSQAHQIWLEWNERRQESITALLFYGHLEKHHSNLLSFRYLGDRYQVVKSWVNEWKSQAY